MKVYFTTTAKGQHPHAAPHLIELGKKAIQSEFNQRYSLAKASNDADLIIYVEPWYIKHRQYVFTLLSEGLIIDSPNRCFVIDIAYMSQGKGFSDSTSEDFVPIDTVSTTNPRELL